MINIRIKNINVKTWLYEYWKDYILETIKYFLNIFKLKTTVEVFVRKTNHTVDAFNTSIAAMATHKRNNIYIIDVYDVLLYQGLDEDDKIFNSIIFHEVCHIFDMYMIKNNENFDITVDTINHYSKEEAIMDIGFDFWTEIFAYSMTKQYVSKQDGANFKEICNVYDSLMKNKLSLPEYTPKKPYLIKIVTDYVNSVHDLLSYIPMNIVNDFNSSLNSDHYLTNFYKKLSPILIKMLKNPYKKSMPNDLLKIGEIILKLYCEPLGFKLINSKNKWNLTYNFKNK